MTDKIKHHFRKVSATLGIRSSVDAILVRSPIKFLKDTIDEKRYLEGVKICVTSYFSMICIASISCNIKCKYRSYRLSSLIQKQSQFRRCLPFFLF